MASGPSAGRLDARLVADISGIVSDLSDDEVDALSSRFDLIAALPKTDAAASELAEGMSAVSSLSSEGAIQLLQVIGDGDWFDRLPAPLPPVVEARLRHWRMRYGPTVEHLLNLNNLPDDWHRVLLNVIRVAYEGATETLVRLQIHNVRGDQFTLEMTPLSYMELCTALLEELASLPDDIVADLGGDEQTAFRAELGRAAARLPGKRATDGPP